MQLTGWQATTFLVGEFQLAETEDQSRLHDRGRPRVALPEPRPNSMVRKMQVMKMRGQAPIPGLHTFRITDQGIQVFPRLIFESPEMRLGGAAKPSVEPRLSVGVTRLGRDVGRRHSVRVLRPRRPDRRDRGRPSSPPSSSAKVPVAANRASLPCSKSARANTRRPVPSGLTEPFAMVRWRIIHTRPLDLSIDETQHELTEAIHRLKARRVVIDSLSGFELALAPTFREDFRESLYAWLRP